MYNLIGCITCFSSRRTFGLRPVKGGGGQALSVVSVVVLSSHTTSGAFSLYASFCMSHPLPKEMLSYGSAGTVGGSAIRHGRALFVLPCGSISGLLPLLVVAFLHLLRMWRCERQQRHVMSCAESLY